MLLPPCALGGKARTDSAAWQKWATIAKTNQFNRGQAFILEKNFIFKIIVLILRNNKNFITHLGIQLILFSLSYSDFNFHVSMK